MFSGWRASDKIFDTPTWRLTVSKELYSDTICFIDSSVPQLSHTGGSSLFIRYWCVSDVCPIRILFNAVFIFLEKFGGDGHVWMVFLISLSFEAPCFHSCSHIMFEMVFVMDLASLRVKQFSLMASGEVITWRAFSSALSFPKIWLWLKFCIQIKLVDWPDCVRSLSWLYIFLMISLVVDRFSILL